jgi:phage terminase small subunit
MARPRPTAETPPPDGLTPSERKFIDEYLIDDNGVRAYRAAYPGATYASARTMAARLLAKVDIKAEVDAARKAQSARTRITADRVLKELAAVAFASLHDVVDTSDPDNPRMRPRTQIPRRAWAAVSSISRTKDGVRVKLFPKDAALDKLMRHLGLFKDLPALELLLNALPSPFADEVRRALARGPDRTDPTTPGAS